jgi:V-type H+-transporting ATPase subunit C
MRDYKPPSEQEGGEEATASQAEQLKRDVEAKKTALEQWSKTAFEEVFSSWVHLVAIRLFVESILRYGLPPAYQAAVIAPQDKSTVKLRQVLNSAFGGGGKAELWSEDVGSAGGLSLAGLAGDSDMHSYVSYTIAME